MKIKSVLLIFCVAFATSIFSQDSTLTVYLIRHAEKLEGKNPPLSSSGQKRAAFYAQFWQEVAIDRIFSTDYQRTQQTVTPLAKQKQLTVASYDPQNLKSFAKQLLQLQGTLVVVGHSNTTPMLAEHLGVHSGPIDDKTEFNRIYQMVFKGEQLVLSNVFYGPDSF